MIKQILYLLCFWAIIQGCTTNNQQLPQITLSYNDPTIEMKFSEIADSIQIIRIETNDSVLVPDYFIPCIGKKYIVAIYSGTIHQFSSNGKYIRTMLSQGRGPEEYLYYNSDIINDNTEKYFLIGDGNNLFSYDLKEGKLLGRQQIPFPMKILQSNNNTLLCIPNYMIQKISCPYQLCSLSPRGTIISKLTDTITNGSMFAISACSTPERQIRLKTQKSDTIYSINNFNKTPTYTIQAIYSDHRVPLSITLYAENYKYYYFQTHSVVIEYNDAGIAKDITRYAPSKNYLVDKKDYSSKIVEKVYIDTLGISVPFTSIHLDPKAPYLTLSAFRFKEALREKAEKHELSPDMQKLYEEVKEDDNPLIFIGQYKK